MIYKNAVYQDRIIRWSKVARMTSCGMGLQGQKPLNYICRMGIKSTLIKPFARAIARRLSADAANAVEIQEGWRQELVKRGAQTRFGRDHSFAQIANYQDFREAIPLRSYEDIRSYVDRIYDGEPDVLWPGRPRFFAKTSGTTSGVKYIPITQESIPNHINTARNALFTYISQTGNAKFFDGKMIFLSGSPALERVNGIPTGRLSGIVNHLVPRWVRGNQLPSYDVNCIEDWEEKLRHIVEETAHRDMRLISGIPPWVQMYYEKLLEATGKTSIAQIFPNYSLFVHGGVNYQPYASKLRALVGRDIDTLETYPASEGFIAFQDAWPNLGLRLNVNSGIFFEFIPTGEVGKDTPQRLHLGDVRIGEDYALIINSNAGLWGYNIGDTIRFVSLDPPRIVVTGRVTHFISAFGEHVIAKEVEEAMNQVCAETGAEVIEFTVAPQVNPEDGGAPYHEWFVEFSRRPSDLDAFAARLDDAMAAQNIYYKDLITGSILRTARVTEMTAQAFRRYMQEEGKLGGQNKLPRLRNNREIADKLQDYVA